jgi:sensor domain CHASE-containing protein
VAVGSQNLLPNRQKVSTYISIFYKYKILTITLAILLAVICTYPGIKVLSIKALFLHIELKHVNLKEAVVTKRIYVVRGYG